MTNFLRKTYLTWFDKKSYTKLIGFEDIGESCIQDFLPRLEDKRLKSGCYPILKETTLKGRTEQAFNLEQYNYLIVFLAENESDLNPPVRQKY